MKSSLNYILSPLHFSHISLGSFAHIMRKLLSTAGKYRNQGQWGASGPTEILNGHSACTNCAHIGWSTSRHRLKTHAGHVANIRDCILAAMLDESTQSTKWRLENGLSMSSKFRWDYARAEDTVAFDAFMGLHGLRLAKSLNPFFRDVKVLCFPQLAVDYRGVSLSMQVTSFTELRRSGLGAS